MRKATLHAHTLKVIFYPPISYQSACKKATLLNEEKLSRERAGSRNKWRKERIVRRGKFTFSSFSYVPHFSPRFISFDTRCYFSLVYFFFSRRHNISIPSFSLFSVFEWERVTLLIWIGWKVNSRFFSEIGKCECIQSQCEEEKIENTVRDEYFYIWLIRVLLVAHRTFALINRWNFSSLIRIKKTKKTYSYNKLHLSGRKKTILIIIVKIISKKIVVSWKKRTPTRTTKIVLSIWI